MWIRNYVYHIIVLNNRLIEGNKFHLYNEKVATKPLSIGTALTSQIPNNQSGNNC